MYSQLTIGFSRILHNPSTCFCEFLLNSIHVLFSNEQEIQEWECKNTSANYEVRKLRKELKSLLDLLAEHESVCANDVPPLTESAKSEYMKLLEDSPTTVSSTQKDGGKMSTK